MVLIIALFSLSRSIVISLAQFIPLKISHLIADNTLRSNLPGDDRRGTSKQSFYFPNAVNRCLAALSSSHGPVATAAALMKKMKASSESAAGIFIDSIQFVFVSKTISQW